MPERAQVIVIADRPYVVRGYRFDPLQQVALSADVRARDNLPLRRARQRWGCGGGGGASRGDGRRRRARPRWSSSRGRARSGGSGRRTLLEEVLYQGPRGSAVYV